MSKRYPFNGYETMASGYTNGLYLPNKPLDEFNIDECRRALCRQANGDVMRCLECENKCRYGRRIEVLLAPVETVEDQTEKTDEKNVERTKKARAKSNTIRMRKAAIKYLRAIASGDPKAYLEAHGMEIRNNMSIIRNRYKGVTPEEARKRLAEMGADVEEAQEMPVSATETPAEQPAQAIADKSPEECETPTIPVKMPASPIKEARTEVYEPVAGVRLQIHTLKGDWFTYTRGIDGLMDIEPNTLCSVTTIADVEAICAEIKAAFEMMGGIKE